MVNVTPINLSNGIAIGISIHYPKTTLLSITTTTGYVMCGVLNVESLDTLHAERQIIAARVTGVKNLEDLLSARIVQCTRKAEEIGIHPGFSGKEALEIMIEYAKKVAVA